MTITQIPVALTPAQLEKIAGAAYMELDRQDDNDQVHDLSNRGNGYVTVGGEVNLPDLVLAVLHAAETATDEIDEDTDKPRPKYPHVRVRLLGEDGNGFMIVTRAGRAMRAAGVSAEEREEFVTTATSGSYEDLLRTVHEWVTVADDGVTD